MPLSILHTTDNFPDTQNSDTFQLWHLESWLNRQSILPNAVFAGHSSVFNFRYGRKTIFPTWTTTNAREFETIEMRLAHFFPRACTKESQGRISVSYCSRHGRVCLVLFHFPRVSRRTNFGHLTRGTWADPESGSRKQWTFANRGLRI